MSEAKRFRDRAVECRALAKSARSEVDAALLEDIAAEFDAEADQIDDDSVGEPTEERRPRTDV